MMDTIIDKFNLIEKIISQEKGNVKLLALFELEDNVQDRWDVIISAENLIPDDIESLKFVVNILQSVLTEKEMVKISKAVLFDPNDEFIIKIERFLNKNKNPKQISNLEINDLIITHGFVIKSSVFEKRTFNRKQDSVRYLFPASKWNETKRTIDIPSKKNFYIPFSGNLEKDNNITIEDHSKYLN